MGTKTKRRAAAAEALKRKHGEDAETVTLQEELRRHQMALAVLAMRDGRIRIEAAELEALNGYRHRIQFDPQDDGSIIINHSCTRRPRP